MSRNIPIASQVARGKPLASGCYAFGHWLHHPATGAPKASRAVFLYSLGNVVLGVVNAKQAIYQSCAVGAVVQGTGLDGAFERGRIQKGTSGLREPRPEGAEGSGEGCRATFEHPQRPTFDGEIAGNDRSDLGGAGMGFIYPIFGESQVVKFDVKLSSQVCRVGVAF
jgi:hypothetical protein